MVKAAVVCSSTARIGHERQGATQINAFEATRRYRKYEPYLFSAAYSNKPFEETLDGVHIIRIRPCPVFRDFFYLLKVSREIKKRGIRIVHVRNRPRYIVPLRRLLGGDAKLVLHEHNQNIADTMSNKEAVRVLETLDAYVGVSRFTTDYEITGRYPQFAKKAHSILNGVNLDKFRPVWEMREKSEKLRKMHGLQGSKVVLFVGAIRERKGIHLLVDAMDKVAKKHPDARLVVAGGSSRNVTATSVFARSAREKAKATFLDFVSSKEIPSVYLLADIFAGPSTWDEPFGLVFAEAQASGLPVVASKRGGIPEIVADRETGLLVEHPENTEELAGAIIDLLDDPAKRERFGRAGRKRMEERFSWDRVAGEIEELYDKL